MLVKSGRYLSFFSFNTLQKVLSPATTPSRHRTAMVGYGAENLEFLLEVLAQVHDGRDVAAAVAVVGSGPNGNDVFVFEVVLLCVSLELCVSAELSTVPCSPR